MKCTQLLAGASVVTLLLALRFLPMGVMSHASPWNEVDVLPLARQAVEPNWMPNDWYLSQPQVYRLAFNQLAGRMIAATGFVAAALIGRLGCYLLLGAGVALIGRAVGLRLFYLGLAASAFFAPDGQQWAAAGEWIAGGFEAKAVAWGLVTIGVGMALHRRYRLAALSVGLATSFHVLVGGWAVLCLAAWMGWLVLTRGEHVPARTLLAAVVLATFAGIFGLAEVCNALAAPRVAGADFVQVFVRLPHHLNPETWRSSDWDRLSVWVILYLIASVAVRSLWFQAQAPTGACGRAGPGACGAADLSLIVGMSLVPFAFGLLASPLDPGGRWLKYFPFRLGDAMLPLGVCLLVARVFQEVASRVRWPSWRRATGVLAGAALATVFVRDAWRFAPRLERVVREVTTGDRPDDPWAQTCRVVQELTPAGAVVLVPPTAPADFSCRSGRATVATFKQFPFSSVGAAEWLARMSAVSPGTDLATLAVSDGYDQWVARRALADGYEQLSTIQAHQAMSRYGATYLLTSPGHKLDLPAIHRNTRFVLYSKGSGGTASLVE